MMWVRLKQCLTEIWESLRELTIGSVYTVVSWAVSGSSPWILKDVASPRLKVWLDWDWGVAHWYAVTLSCAMAYSFHKLHLREKATCKEVKQKMDEIARLTTKQPRLIWSEPFLEHLAIKITDPPAPMWYDGGFRTADPSTSVPYGAGPVVETLRPSVLCLHVFNQPTKNEEIAPAFKASVEAMFTDTETGERVKVPFARWPDNQPIQIPMTESVDRLRYYTLEPDGVEHRIDLIMKYLEDGLCYGIRITTPLEYKPDWRDMTYMLDPGRYNVCVTLRASGLLKPLVKQFTIVNEGKNGSIRIT